MAIETKTFSVQFTEAELETISAAMDDYRCYADDEAAGGTKMNINIDEMNQRMLMFQDKNQNGWITNHTDNSIQKQTWAKQHILRIAAAAGAADDDSDDGGCCDDGDDDDGDDDDDDADADDDDNDDDGGW